MTSELRQHLAEYDRAVALADETYLGMSADERGIRAVAARQLAKHAPSDRSAPTCTGCNGGPWPCSTVKGAIILADPRYN